MPARPDVCGYGYDEWHQCARKLRLTKRQAEARVERLRRRKRRYRCYECPFCGGWHLAKERQ